MVANFMSTIGSALGNAFSSLQNFNFSNGGGTNLKDSLGLMDAQSIHWRKNTEWYNDNILPDAYVRTRNALEKAGYNPLMGIGTPLADQGVMPNATAQTSAKSIGLTKTAFAQATLKNLNADTQTKQAETAYKDASAKLTLQQKQTEIQKTKLEEIEVQIGEIRKKIADKDYTTYDIRLLNELNKTKAEMIKAMAAKDSVVAQRDMVSAKQEENEIKRQELKEKKGRSSYTIKIGPVSYSREGKNFGTEKEYYYEPEYRNGRRVEKEIKNPKYK